MTGRVNKNKSRVGLELNNFAELTKLTDFAKEGDIFLWLCHNNILFLCGVGESKDVKIGKICVAPF